MWYVVYYVTSFGNPIVNCLNEDEFKTMTIPCNVLYQSENYRDAIKEYERYLP